MEEKTNLFPIVKAISEEKNYEYNPAVPVLKNKEKLEEIIKLINEKNEKSIITEENLKDYTCKNNILAQLRKIVNELKSTKTSVHREAKNAYKDFDNEVDYLINELNKSVDNLSQQVNYFQEKKREEKTKNVKETFDNLLEDFKKHKMLDIDFECHPKMLSFDMWFDNKKISLSNKKLVEDIKDYFTSQLEDYKTFYEFAKEDSTLEKLFLKAYDMNNSASESFSIAKKQKKEMDELYEIEQIKKAEEQRRQKEEMARLKEENERLKQQQEETKQVETKDENDEKIEKIEENQYFAFILNDIQQAKLVKNFCDENNIEYVFSEIDDI